MPRGERSGPLVISLQGHLNMIRTVRDLELGIKVLVTLLIYILLWTSHLAYQFW